MKSDSTRGFLFAASAYFLWGLFPIYWKQLGQVPAAEVLAHRVTWSFVFIALFVGAVRGFPAVRDAVVNPKPRRAMLASTFLISINWFLFIWAVSHQRILEASLGYYLNPLLNVLVGAWLLKERLSRAQLVAVLLATLGVVNLAVAKGSLPWISVALAISFCLYGLVRKQAPVAARTGLFVETGLAAPFALAYLAYLALAAPSGGSSFSATELALLVGSGAATALPLLWFAEGARRLRYSTLGIIQYIAPTLQLGCAVVLYGEPFTQAHAVTFAFIWSAVLLYAVDALWRSRGARTPAPAEPAELLADRPARG
jgi:chloramphenicol-sensitive protein RarD